MSVSTHERAPHTEPTSDPSTGRTSQWSAARLVAEREIQTSVRSKSFWLSFGVYILGIVALAILPNVFGGGPSSVATVGPEASQMVAQTELEASAAGNVDAAEERVRAGDVDAAVVPDPSGESATGVRVLATSDVPDDVLQGLSAPPPVDLLEPSDVAPGMRAVVALVFGLVFMMMVMTFGMTIAQSVVTEKQTRIVEILVATVAVRALLAGKIVGHSLLVFAQAAVFALVGLVALRVGDHADLLSSMGGAIGWYVPFLGVGFVLLAAIWAVGGALVSRQEDLGSTTGIAVMLAMAPYFGAVLLQSNERAMTVMSYVPFTSPVAMPMRMFTGDAQTWEPIVAFVLLLVAVVVAILVASRLYTGAVLQTGGRVALAKAWARMD